MRSDPGLEVADCSEFRLALQARPPGIVHGSLFLLVSLLGATLAWSAATKANLVVRAPGRVRPVTAPMKVYNAARGEVLNASAGGRVAEVKARAGDIVRRGDILLRLETERLDNEIAKQRRTIRAGEAELMNLGRLEGLMTQQFRAAKAKAAAELEQARQEVCRAKERRDSEIRLAEATLRPAELDEAYYNRLVKKGYAAPASLLRATMNVQQAQEKLSMARIPIDEGRVTILLQALELVERDYIVRREELKLKRETRRGEVETARLELSNLELERGQAVIRAPIDGIVTAGDLKVDDVLATGVVVMEIARLEGFRFEAAVPGGDVGLLRVGLPARIKLDAYDYQRYGTADGTVCYISPDSEVADAQNASTYVAKISISKEEIGQGAYRGRVKLGMSGQAEIVTGQESLLSLLVKRIRQTISLN